MVKMFDERRCINDIKFYKMRVKACYLTWIYKLATKRSIPAYWNKRVGISFLNWSLMI